MKKKRWIGMLLVFVLLFALAGCGATGQAQNEKKNETEATPQTEAAKTETVETEAADAVEKNTGDGKTLVVYFSYTGHLDSMAHWIADESGADLVRVTAKEAYPEDYDETVDRAKKEQDDDARPEIDIDLTEEQMAEYDTVFFGFPVWWYREPSIVDTFLEDTDFSGKTLIPFVTSSASGMGSIMDNIRRLAPGAKVCDGRRFDIQVSGDTLRKWAEELGI
jgi:flavodoxin